MRIIAGRLKGLVFDSPKSFFTHPMSEKMRGALFNILGDIEGMTVFDAYGGSGSMAFESISRGAKGAVICEIDKNAIKAIENNINKLNVGDKVKLYKNNSAKWSQENPDIGFDIVIADPPYNDVSWSQLKHIFNSVKKSGLMVLSLPSEVPREILENSDIIADKSYGDGSLVFYRKKQ